MKIRCQFCGAIYNVPETASGKKVHCRKCDTTFVCPSPSQNSLETGNENLPATFANPQNVPRKRAKQSAQSRKKQEDAILKQHMSASTIQKERKNARHAKAIEDNRSNNSVVSMICGGVAMTAAIGLGIALWSMTVSPMGEGMTGRKSRSLMILHYTGGKYWAPPLLFLVGLYFFVIGILSHKRIINLEPHHYLNTFWDFAYSGWLGGRWLGGRWWW